jgi:hypothetical protein
LTSRSTVENSCDQQSGNATAATAPALADAISGAGPKAEPQKRRAKPLLQKQKTFRIHSPNVMPTLGPRFFICNLSHFIRIIGVATSLSPNRGRK